VLAAVALLANASGSAPQGATALRALLFSTGGNADFTGLSLRERVTKIRDLGLDTAGLKDLLGRKEAIRGFTDLENQLGAFDRVLAAVQGANVDTSAIDRKLAFVSSAQEAADLKAIAEGRVEGSRQRFGAREAILDAIAARTRERVRRGDITGLGFAGPEPGDDFVFGNLPDLGVFNTLASGRNPFRGAFLGQFANEQERAALEELRGQGRVQREQLDELKGLRSAIENNGGGVPVTNE